MVIQSGSGVSVSNSVFSVNYGAGMQVLGTPTSFAVDSSTVSGNAGDGITFNAQTV